MYLLWRSVYWLLDRKVVIAIAAAFVRLATRFTQESFVEGLLGWGERACVYSGWPGHQPGWVNLHMSRFFWRVKRHVGGAKSVPAKRPRIRASRRRLRIGCVGKFCDLLSFSKTLFEAFPGDADLVVIDLAYGGRSAIYLKPLASDYIPVDLEHPGSYAKELRQAAAAISRADLDLLLNVGWKQDTYDLLDLVETPCIANYCTGSDLLHHEKVTFQLHALPQADYFPRDHALFCGVTRSRFSDDLVYPANAYYDPRDVRATRQRAWSEREPLIVFHGSLYKLARPELLDVVFDLVAQDRSLDFVFMGKDDGVALAAITRMASRRGVSPRVHYEGQFSSLRNEQGEIDDPGWGKLFSHLRRARLAPDPWPLGGGSARCEAYLAGAPSVHMGVCFDRASWGRPQHAAYELPYLLVPLGTATSPQGYGDLCRKCLYDEHYATRLVAQQLERARAATDAVSWWRQVLESYHHWRTLVEERQSPQSSGRREVVSTPLPTRGHHEAHAPIRRASNPL